MRSKPTVFVLGCYHELQEHPSSYHESDGNKYTDALEQQLKNGVISFIGEEAGTMTNTFARRVAADRCIEYANIDIPTQAKEQIRYVYLGEQQFDDKKQAFVPVNTHSQYRKAWNLVREFHMYKSFEVLSSKHPSSLLICGLLHRIPLKTLLEDTHEVCDITPNYDLFQS
jgi:hypothetical protein